MNRLLLEFMYSVGCPPFAVTPIPGERRSAMSFLSAISLRRLADQRPIISSSVVTPNFSASRRPSMSV